MMSGRHSPQQLQVPFTTEQPAHVGQDLATVGQTGADLGRVGQEVEGSAASEPAEVELGLFPSVLRSQESIGWGAIDGVEFGDPAFPVGIGAHRPRICGEQFVPSHDTTTEWGADWQRALSQFDLEQKIATIQTARDAAAVDGYAVADEIGNEAVETYSQACLVRRVGLDPEVAG